jgi:hypothetical protein
MRHRAILSLALILGLVPTLNTTPLLAMQDQDDECEREEKRVRAEFKYELDCESAFSLGLEFTAGPAAESADAERVYAVRFVGEAEYADAGTPEAGKEGSTPESGNVVGAYIPERFNSQAMFVNVVAGSFAFRTQGPGVIVTPQDNALEKYTATVSIKLGTDPNFRDPATPEDSVKPREFNDGGSFPCNLNPPGHALCLLDPDAFDDGVTFARLDAGDTVYLPDNSTCFLCNTEQIGSTPAEVLIWTPTTGLTEIGGELESITNAMASPSSGTPTAQGSGRIVGWMFNPGSRCSP